MSRSRCAPRCTSHLGKHAEPTGYQAPSRAALSLKGVETPFSGTALLLAVAAVLWLVYLVPIWLRRSEYLATERNAARLGQTLRVLAETTEPTQELRAELSAREVAKQRREAERRLREVSYDRKEIAAKRRRILRSTTTMFTIIGAAGLVSSISLQAALWVTVGLAVKTGLGFVTLWILQRAAKRAARREAISAPHTPAVAQRRVVSTRAWTPPALPAPLSAKAPIVAASSALPSREELLRKARAAAAQARPEEAAAEASQMAPVSNFRQMGTVPSAPRSTPDLDEVLRRRRAV